MAATVRLCGRLPCIVPCTILQTRTVITMESVPIISKPVSWTKKYVKRHEAKEEKKFKERAESQRLRQKMCVLSCKNSKLNHYQGTQFNKFQTIPLASRGWKKSKSVGDFFTINPISQNPAVQCSGKTFEDCSLQAPVIEAIRKMGFTEPTNIQALAMPVVGGGHNTLISSETGNGKTMAFVAPLIQEVLHWKQSTQNQDFVALNSPALIIIAPGRELAMQIFHVCRRVCLPLSLHAESQLGAYRTKLKMRFPRLLPMDVLVATPGVLTKLISTGVIKTDSVRHVVLDEADTLLDDSFADLTKRILSRIPVRNSADDTTSGVQLVMAGATLPRDIDNTLEGVLQVENIKRVNTPILHHIMPHVKQKFIRTNTSKKIDWIIDLAKSADQHKRPTIIFCNSSKTSHWLGLMLKDHDIKCIHIGGKQDANIRRLMYKMFMCGECSVLIATDIVSRGLDTTNVSHVVNYDLPDYMSDYVHRCGRVGRVGSVSTAQPMVTSIVSKPFEVDLVHQIELAARKATELPNVNANIKKLYKEDFDRREETQRTITELQHVKRQMKKAGKVEKSEAMTEDELVKIWISNNET